VQHSSRGFIQKTLSLASFATAKWSLRPAGSTLTHEQIRTSH
jgi:hypothetical protein